MSDDLADLLDLFTDRGSHLSLTEARLILALKGRSGSVSFDSLIDTLWGDDPDGGPLSARDELKVMASHCRKRIKKAGLPWKIQNTYGFGYRFIP